jgi:outer membrane murein-binding lipoprotein Lpp
MSAGAVKSGATGDLLQAKNIQAQSVGTAIGGIGTVLSSPFSFAGTMMEAENKELEADAERMRATQEQLSRIDDALREVLQKARSTQDAIQQNMNQTRAKILG